MKKKWYSEQIVHYKNKRTKIFRLTDICHSVYLCVLGLCSCQKLLTYFKFFSIAIIILSSNQAYSAHEKEQKELEKMLIAPCCWTSTIDVHPSEISEKMKKEIADLLKQGKTKDEIIKYYIDKYGERIVAIPQSRFNKYAVYLIPTGTLLAGIFIILTFLKSHQKPLSLSNIENRIRHDKWWKEAEDELEKWDR